jgi:hypothetical protein
MMLPQHSSTPFALHIVAGTSTSAQTRKPPGKISTHFDPGHCASVLQSPEPIDAPPAPLLVLPAVALVLLLADDVDPLEVPLPPLPVVVALVVVLPVPPAPPAPPVPAGVTEPPQPAHVSMVRAVKVKNRILVSSRHRRADPAEIQADRRDPAVRSPFLAEARGVI